MEHLREVDQVDRTVVMMQVENETGLLGTDRDYSPEAARRFEGLVPTELMTYLSAHRGTLMPSLDAAWEAAKFRSAGTSTEVFGELAPEVFSDGTSLAMSIAWQPQASVLIRFRCMPTTGSSIRGTSGRANGRAAAPPCTPWTSGKPPLPISIFSRRTSTYRGLRKHATRTTRG